MMLQRTIVTTTTPMIVTTIQTVTGKVWHVNPPSMVILTLEDNTNQEFKIPKDQKFNVGGEMLDAFALRKGMNVSATKIVEVPTVVSSKQQSVTGKSPPPPDLATQAQHVTGTVPSSPAPNAPLLLRQESRLLCRLRRHNLLLLSNRLRRDQTTFFGSAWP